MRIGIEAQRLFRTKKHGMDFVALELIRALQKIDKVNQYYIFINVGPDRCIEETANFKIVEFAGWYPVWEQIYLPIRAGRLKLDLLHCTSNLLPVLARVPLIVTIHDIIYLEANMMWKKGFTLYQRFGNIYRKYLAPYVVRKASKIITVSYSERKLLLQMPYVNAQKIKVVYNAVGDHFRKPVTEQAAETIKQKYGLPGKYIFFLGNTDPKKNTDNVILAYIYLREKKEVDVDLVVGDLDEVYLLNLLQQINKMEYRRHIYLCGYIRNQDMPGVIGKALLFLYPSKRESFGIPILEAMSQSVPVVTSCAFAMPEVSGDAAELVDPESIEGIAAGIHRMVEDEDLRATMIARGLKRAKEFSWQTSAQAILNIYKEEVLDHV